MEQRRIGATGASVGVIGLGTASWGAGTDAASAREQVAMLLSSGGNLVDICPMTTDPNLIRHSIVGPGMRTGTFLAVRTPAHGSRRDMLGALDAALAAMDIGHADSWVIEGWDEQAPWEEIAGALAVATSTGRAMYAGLCPAEAWQGALVGAGLSAQPDRSPLATLTLPYSLLDHASALPGTHVAAALGCSVLAAWPMAGGVLTGKYRHATPPDSRGAGERYAGRLHRYREPWARPMVDALCAAAEGLGVTPGALALAWTRDRPMVAAVIAGARTVHQWRAALDSAQVTMPSEIRHVLDEVASQAVDVRQDEPER